jgi:hypothetical protein
MAHDALILIEGGFAEIKSEDVNTHGFVAAVAKFKVLRIIE